jgi:hypothetical protein
LNVPDITDVKTFKSKRMAIRSAFEWKGFTMGLDDAVDNGWISE